MLAPRFADANEEDSTRIGSAHRSGWSVLKQLVKFDSIVFRAMCKLVRVGTHASTLNKNTAMWTSGIGRPQQTRDTRKSIAFSAKPRATDVNSFPPRIRFFPNRVSKIFLTASTNEEPPVRKTILTSLGRTPEESRRESTQRAICSSSSEIHSSKDARSTDRKS